MKELTRRFLGGTGIHLASDRCPKCGRRPMVTDPARGEMVCGFCGFVVKEKMEEAGPEWRAFSKEELEERSRAGAPTSLTMPDMGLSTQIGREGTDASGKALTGGVRTAMERLRIWDIRSRAHSSVDRNLRQAFSELDGMADKLSISGVVAERAAYTYRKAVERGLVKGRSISMMIAASVYAACREAGIPRTLKDVAAASGVRKKEIARCYRLLFNELELQMPVMDPAKCISRIASMAGASERTKRRAIEILKKAMESGRSAGKDPTGLAAAALYMACVLEGEKRTQREIVEAAGITEVTIRNRCNGLEKEVHGLAEAIEKAPFGRRRKGEVN